MTTVAASVLADFVDLEADLLDDRRFDEWLDLFTDDAVYWVPLTPDQADPRDAPSLIWETKDALTARVLRLGDPQTIVQQPYSRWRRIMGRVRAEPPTGNGDATIAVRAAFHLVEAVANHDAEDLARIFAGTVRWDLVDTADEGLRIRRKRIDLVNSERGLYGVSVLF